MYFIDLKYLIAIEASFWNNIKANTCDDIKTVSY